MKEADVDFRNSGGVVQSKFYVTEIDAFLNDRIDQTCLGTMSTKLRDIMISSMKSSNFSTNILSAAAATDFHFVARDRCATVINEFAHDIFSRAFDCEVAVGLLKMVWMKVERRFLESCRKLALCHGLTVSIESMFESDT